MASGEREAEAGWARAVAPAAAEVATKEATAAGMEVESQEAGVEVRWAAGR